MTNESLNEGFLDDSGIINYKVQRALDNAKELQGWDYGSMSPEENRFYDLGNFASVTARFMDEETANKWLKMSHADRGKVRKWHDERLWMDCALATAYFDLDETESEFAFQESLKPSRILKEMDKQLRQLTRGVQDSNQVFLARFRSGQIDPDAVRILAGLEYEPALLVAKQYLPPTERGGNYDRRKSWEDNTKIEVALEEGGELGEEIASDIMLRIVEFVRKRVESALPDELDATTEVIQAICDTILAAQAGGRELRGVIDAAIDEIRYDGHIYNEEARHHVARLVGALGIANLWLTPNATRHHYYIGNALRVCKNMGFNLNEVRQLIINRLT